MSKKTNLLLKVAELSLEATRACPAPYSRPKSPRKFTQPQLMTCLVPRASLKTTYRGVIEILETSEALRKRLGLNRLPHDSTLKRFADRVDVTEITDAVLANLLQRVGKTGREVAMDSTGLETTSASAHYRSRTGRRRPKYVKVSVAVTCGSILVTAATAGGGRETTRSRLGACLEESPEKYNSSFSTRTRGMTRNGSMSIAAAGGCEVGFRRSRIDETAASTGIGVPR